MAEAAGLVLAVLPLIISAVEHYEQCLKPVQRFIKFTSQAKRFQQKFDVQKTIFRNQCLLLLQEVVESNVAHLMISDGKHPCWTNVEVDGELGKQLEASGNSCFEVIKEINAVLVRVQIWSSTLDDTIEQEGKACPFGGKVWRSIVRTKLKFSFSESLLDDSLVELKDLNNSFLTLSDQTSKLHEHEIKNHSLAKPFAKDIAKVKFIQQASCRVYEALGRSCSKHSEHRTQFCLEAKSIGSPESPQVQFRVAFARVASREAAGVCDPIFFTIESCITESAAATPVESSVSTINKLKRNLASETAGSAKKIKSLTFESVECSHLCYQLPAADLQDLKDLCSNQNFCDRLRDCLQQCPEGLQYMGTLGSTDPYRHLVYLPEKKKVHRPMLSLKDIITMSSRQGLSVRLSIYERLHLAHSLAMAVLQYYATPWLSGPLRCEDIFFYDVEERLLPQRSSNSISEPHIDAHIVHPNPTLSIPTTGVIEHLAPNILLFNLGIMLIELAYMTTFRDLLSLKELSYRDSQYTEFLAARRLGILVSRELGSKYGKIVQKCLGCHFAAGPDLSSSELQAEYYRDVVKELEGIEDDLASLKMDS